MAMDQNALLHAVAVVQDDWILGFSSNCIVYRNVRVWESYEFNLVFLSHLAHEINSACMHTIFAALCDIQTSHPECSTLITITVPGFLVFFFHHATA